MCTSDSLTGCRAFSTGLSPRSCRSALPGEERRGPNYVCSCNRLPVRLRAQARNADATSRLSGIGRERAVFDPCPALALPAHYRIAGITCNSRVTGKLCARAWASQRPAQRNREAHLAPRRRENGVDVPRAAGLLTALAESRHAASSTLSSARETPARYQSRSLPFDLVLSNQSIWPAPSP